MAILLNDKEYLDMLGEIKRRIYEAQRNAALSVNSELILLHWNIGKIIDERSAWGNKFVENLERDLRIEFPKYRGFSLRNLKYMAKFYRENKDEQIVQSVIAQLPWTHNIILMDTVKDATARQWYMQQAIENGWSVRHLSHQIETELHKRQALTGKPNNFELTLPSPQSKLVADATKDPYIFDFIAGADDFYETKIEQALVDNVAKLLLELGTGFAFVGHQYRTVVSGKEYFIDMLFYNLELRCFVVVELKNAEFEPRDVGQLNFYLSAIDDQLKRKGDNPTIGLLLCKKKDNITAEYALRKMSQPIGVSEFKLSSKLPKELANVLPSVEDIRSRIKFG